MASCGWFPMNPGEIRAWLRAHPDAAPHTLEDLGRFPMAFRRVMISDATPELRLQLWREHLETFLTPESPLAAEQRAFVAATIPELPQLLAAPAPNPTMRAWEQRAGAVFTPEEAGRIFMLIGPREPPEGIPLPADAHPTLAS